MRSCPDVTKMQIKKLQNKGITTTLDQIAWLISLGWKVENPNGSTNPLHGAVPVVAGCERLFPLTNAASWWIDLCQRGGWFGDDVGMLRAIAFAHAHGRQRGVFADLVTKRAAVDAVNNWSRGLTCTDVELAQAITILADNDAPANGEDTDNAWLMARVEAATGISRDHWETRTIDDAILALLASAEHSANMAGADVDIAAEQSKAAFVDLIRAVAEIEAEWQTKQQ